MVDKNPSAAFKAQLLRSAREIDRPSQASRRRVGMAIGAGAGTVLSVSSAAAGSKLVLMSLVKAFGVGALLGVGTLTVAHVAKTVSTPTHTPQTPAIVISVAPEPCTHVRSAPVESTAPATSVRPPSLTNSGGAVVTETEPIPEASVNAPIPVVESVPAASAGPKVSQELQKIDEARARLAKGDVEGALREMNRYDIDHPAGLLAEEAMVVRIEALARKGEWLTAQGLAQRFTRTYPNSPYAGRVRAAMANFKILGASSDH